MTVSRAEFENLESRVDRLEGTYRNFLRALSEGFDRMDKTMNERFDELKDVIQSQHSENGKGD